MGSIFSTAIEILIYLNCLCRLQFDCYLNIVANRQSYPAQLWWILTGLQLSLLCTYLANPEGLPRLFRLKENHLLKRKHTLFSLSLIRLDLLYNKMPIGSLDE